MNCCIRLFLYIIFIKSSTYNSNNNNRHNCNGNNCSRGSSNSNSNSNSHRNINTFLAYAQAQHEPEPEFLSQLSNVTIAQGRDVSFTCVVNNLGQYRVAWIKSDSKAILSIHTHMVSLNPRLSVTHNGHNTWKLHISHVQLNDSGTYMCQVNTDPMKSQFGNLDVVVPPDILNYPNHNFEENITNEGGTIILTCNATGVPQPTILWRREDVKDIMIRTDPRDRQAVKVVKGERLQINNVQRTDMGAYLCIASNGIPPSVSKRFDVRVNFPPSIKAVNQLVVAPIEREVTLECIVEVHPKSLNGWYRDEGNLKLHNGHKYNITEIVINMYTWQLNLTVRNLAKDDFGAYSCSSVNALGKSEARIRLQELRLPPKPTTTVVSYIHTTPKFRRKQSFNMSKGVNEVIRDKEIYLRGTMQDNKILGGLSSGAINTNNNFSNHNHNNNNNNNNNNINNNGGIIMRGAYDNKKYTGIRIGDILRPNSINGVKNLITETEDNTQLPPKNDNEKIYKRPSAAPSPRSPWIITSGATAAITLTTKITTIIVTIIAIILTIIIPKTTTIIRTTTTIIIIIIIIRIIRIIVLKVCSINVGFYIWRNQTNLYLMIWPIFLCLYLPFFFFLNTNTLYTN